MARDFGRFGGRSALRQGQRRKTIWVGRTKMTAVAALGANSVILDSIADAGTLARRPFTIVRVRGLVLWMSDQIAAQEEPTGAIGFAVTSDQAQAIGITALPLPASDVQSDKFFVWQALMHGQHANSGNQRGSSFELDSKAMRKVGDGETISVMLENASALDGAEYLLAYRILLKLH